MSERTIDSVVFDIGGVLLDWSPDYLYAELIPDVLGPFHIPLHPRRTLRLGLFGLNWRDTTATCWCRR